MISNPQIFPETPGIPIVFAESTQAMGSERFAKNKFVDDEAAYSEDDADLDAPLAELALTDPEEARLIELDQQFINDEEPLPEFLDNEQSSQEESPPVAVRRSSRLNRTGSAEDPRTKALPNHHAQHSDFGSSDSEASTKSSSEDEEDKQKKRGECGKDKTKRKPRANKAKSKSK